MKKIYKVYTLTYVIINYINSNNKYKYTNS